MNQSSFWTQLKNNIQPYADYWLSHLLYHGTGHVTVLGLNSIGSDFKDYIFNEDMKSRVSALKKGLDPKSIEVLDLLIKRIKNDMPLQRENGELIIVDPKKDLTKEEWDQGRVFKKNVFSLRKRYKLPCFEHSMDTFLYHKGLKFVPQKALEYIRNKDFIDGGACYGDSVLILRDYSPRRIYSFETSEKNGEMYKKTMSRNGVSNDLFRLVLCGVGEKDETIYIAEPESASTFSNLHQAGSQAVQISKIDTYVKENNLNVGVIKLDVEGYESATMRGAVETLKRDRPVLLLSIYHNPHDFFELKPYLESLDLGYHFLIRQLAPAAIPGIPLRYGVFWLQHVVQCIETTLIAYPEEFGEPIEFFPA